MNGEKAFAYTSSAVKVLQLRETISDDAPKKDFSAV